MRSISKIRKPSKLSKKRSSRKLSKKRSIRKSRSKLSKKRSTKKRSKHSSKLIKNKDGGITPENALKYVKNFIKNSKEYGNKSVDWIIEDYKKNPEKYKKYAGGLLAIALGVLVVIGIKYISRDEDREEAEKLAQDYINKCVDEKVISKENSKVLYLNEGSHNYIFKVGNDKIIRIPKKYIHKNGKKQNVTYSGGLIYDAKVLSRYEITPKLHKICPELALYDYYDTDISDILTNKDISEDIKTSVIRTTINIIKKVYNLNYYCSDIKYNNFVAKKRDKITETTNDTYNKYYDIRMIDIDDCAFVIFKNNDMINNDMINNDMINNDMVNNDMINNDMINNDMINNDMVNNYMINNDMINNDMINNDMVNNYIKIKEETKNFYTILSIYQFCFLLDKELSIKLDISSFISEIVDNKYDIETIIKIEIDSENPYNYYLGPLNHYTKHYTESNFDINTIVSIIQNLPDRT
jgi:hypothetical protein